MHANVRLYVAVLCIAAHYEWCLDTVSSSFQCMTHNGIPQCALHSLWHMEQKSTCMLIGLLRCVDSPFITTYHNRPDSHEWTLKIYVRTKKMNMQYIPAIHACFLMFYPFTEHSSRGEMSEMYSAPNFLLCADKTWLFCRMWF